MATSTHNSALGTQGGSSSRSSSTSEPSAPKARMTGDPSLDWWIQMDERLEKMGYSDRAGRCGMIEAYIGFSGQDEKDNMWNKWTNRDGKDEICAAYKARLEASRPKHLAPLPKEERFDDVYQKLADYYPDPLVRWAMMYKLRRWTDKKQAEITLNKWLTEPNEIRRRTAQYRQIGLDKGALKRRWVAILMTARTMGGRLMAQVDRMSYHNPTPRNQCIALISRATSERGTLRMPLARATSRNQPTKSESRKTVKRPKRGRNKSKRRGRDESWTTSS